MRLLLLVIICCAFNLVLSQIDQQPLAKIWFEDTFVINQGGSFTITDQYTQTGSLWAIDSFPESVVFHKELQYQHPSIADRSYKLRVGKGGQIYSFRGAFGESVPPQWRNPNGIPSTYGGGSSYAPWVDEVWQSVAVSNLNNPPDSAYFIHQAGVYLRTPEQTQPFYSPIVAEYYDSLRQSYTTVNWGQQAHTQTLAQSQFKSSILFYTQYRNVGGGIIEVSNMLYNFGPDTMTFLNIPWGGVRSSSLDHFFISTPTNGFTNSPGQYGQTPVVNTNTTGGWMAWSNHPLGISPSLGFATSKRTNTNNNVFRYGDAGVAPNARDYNVFEMIRFPATNQLNFGKMLSFRYYYLLDANIAGLSNSIQSHQLVNHSLDTSFTPLANEIDTVYYQLKRDNGITIMNSTASVSTIQLAAMPFENSRPLFFITDSSGAFSISSDPYYFSPVPYDGKTLNWQLLGFKERATTLDYASQQLCSGMSYTLPNGTSLHNLQSDTIVSYWQYGPSTDTFVVRSIDVVAPAGIVQQSASSLWAVNLQGAAYQWYDCSSETIVVGATDTVFVPSSNGLYAAIVEYNGCIDTTNCFLFQTNGNGVDLEKNNVEIFPNPTSDQVTIRFPQSSSGVIYFYATNGEMINVYPYLQQTELTLKMPEENGFYLLRIQDQSQCSVWKRMAKN